MHERVAVSTAELDDLDLDALDRFLAARLPGASRDDAGIKLGLLAKAASRTVPTVAGLYLFGKAPQLAMPEWGLVAVAFAGPTLASAVRERDDAEGGVASLLERGLAFARRHASASGPGGGE
ncbi:MAG TPA: hypothetical protein VHB21_00975, partial [Minicystis sp.]|nr:hypothetical protein [Minicystis sp.]